MKRPSGDKTRKINISSIIGFFCMILGLTCLLIAAIIPKYYIIPSYHYLNLIILVTIVLSLVAGTAFSIAGGIKTLIDKNISSGYTVPAIAGNLLFVFILITILLPNFLKARTQGSMHSCEHNLKNIAVALEIYKEEFGNYPSSLECLTDTSIMRALPKCPNFTNTSYGYEYNNNPPDFTLQCGAEKAHIDTGKHHTEGHWPQYTSKKGLMFKPEE